MTDRKTQLRAEHREKMRKRREQYAEQERELTRARFRFYLTHARSKYIPGQKKTAE